jgi:rod shape-determining protein MreD
MIWARRFAPIGSIAVLTVLAALPWGLPAEDRFFLPLLPVIAIHFWTLRHDAWIPEWLVFLAGLAVDVLTQGPLGYWSLIYLVAHLAATFSAPYAGQGSLSRLGLLGLALALVTALAWLVSSIYFLELADAGPYLAGLAFAAVSALLLLPALHALDAPDRSRDGMRLFRGV